MELVTKITRAIKTKNILFGVFLDLSKAFDTVNHKILLHKLEHYGIIGVALDWFKNYLSNRIQVVKYNSARSHSLEIKCGVPLGSVLRPLLFLIYMNDICKCSRLLSFILFADNTNLFLSHQDTDNLYNAMNQELKNITTWLLTNKLSLNVNETHFMIFKTKNRTFSQRMSIMIDGQQIGQVKYTQFLGLFIDEELSWKYHINHVTMKISKLTGIIAKARHYLSLKTLQNLYYTRIYPYLIHCNTVWTNTYATRLKPIYMIQKKIVRLMTFSRYRKETGPIFTSLKLLKIYQLNLFFTAQFMYSYFMIAYQCSTKTISQQMIKFIHTIHDQHRIYTLLINGQIMVNFLLSTEEQSYGTAYRLF